MTVELIAPDGQVTYRLEKEDLLPSLRHMYSFRTYAPITGNWKLCLRRARDAKFPRTRLSFQYRQGDSSWDKIASKRDLTPLEMMVRSLQRNLRVAGDEQKLLKRGERDLRDTSEAINTKVLWLSVFQIIFVSVVTVLKTLLIKSIFEDSRQLRKLKNATMKGADTMKTFANDLHRQASDLGAPMGKKINQFYRQHVQVRMPQLGLNTGMPSAMSTATSVSNAQSPVASMPSMSAEPPVQAAVTPTSECSGHVRFADTASYHPPAAHQRSSSPVIERAPFVQSNHTD
ncbi:MAG: hypothetical protein MHM6MM_001460 [Cercozoa sp. M6MM]